MAVYQQRVTSLPNQFPPVNPLIVQFQRLQVFHFREFSFYRRDLPLVPLASALAVHLPHMIFAVTAAREHCTAAHLKWRILLFRANPLA
jgi:hypothetical protein